MSEGCLANSEAANRALRRLDWIAKLSKENCPGGAPTDIAGFRSLLNRIVCDVRIARAELKATAGDRSNLAERPKAPPGPGLIPTHGGYRGLKSFQVTEIIYDGTVMFCDRFVPKRSRTHDQMVQAARSGRQNIAEASVASATSKKTELKLTNVAKASLEELLLDLEDFLRQRGLRQWDKNDPEALAVRNRYRDFPLEWFGERVESDRSDLSDRSDKSETVGRRNLLDPYGIAEATPEVAANMLICLTNQAIYLLKRQIQRLEQDFVEQGGFTERLYRVRSQRRQQS